MAALGPRADALLRGVALGCQGAVLVVRLPGLGGCRLRAELGLLVGGSLFSDLGAVGRGVRGGQRLGEVFELFARSFDAEAQLRDAAECHHSRADEEAQ